MIVHTPIAPPARFSQFTKFALAALAGLLSTHCGGNLKTEDSPSRKAASVSHAIVTTPVIIGHRGAAGYLPEHTAEGYRLGAQKGADFIESDLVMTKDHVLVVRHENNIAETTDVAAKFPDRLRTKVVDGTSITGYFTEDFTLAEIKTLFAKERLATRDHSHDGMYRVVTFEEYLDVAEELSKTLRRRIGVYIETKHPTYFEGIGLPLEKSVAEVLIKHGYGKPGQKIFMQSFELGSLAKLAKLIDVPRIFLIDDPQTRPADNVKSGDPRTYGDLIKTDSLQRLSKVISGIGPWKDLIVSQNETGQMNAPSSLIDDAHAAGLLVHPYTFRSDAPFLPTSYKGSVKAEYLKYFELGVDGVFSDFAGDAFVARTEFLADRSKRD